jgi:hypothetical protein
LGDVTDPNGDTIHILKANRKPFEVSPSDLADDVVSNLEEVPPEEFLCNEDLSIPDKCDLFAFSPYRSLPEELRKQIEEVMSDDVNRDERWTEAGPKLVADMVAANQALIRVVRANDAIVKSMQQLTQIAEAGREVRSD